MSLAGAAQPSFPPRSKPAARLVTMRHPTTMSPPRTSAFAVSMHAHPRAPHSRTSPRRPRRLDLAATLTPLPTRLQLTRLRMHLLHHACLAARVDGTSEPAPGPPAKPRRRPTYSPEERRARSQRLRDRWADPEWRAAMMMRRRQSGAFQKISDAAKRHWQDPDYRARMRQARLGRPAPNKGVSPSAVTRLRMSVARKGLPVSEATRKKMSLAKLSRPEGDDWPRLISESKRGKTREYFQMRREFRALHRDLKLWSDSFRSKYGQLPDASTYERFVAPMMIFRIKRYLVLRDAIGDDEPDVQKDIISRH